MSIWRKVLGNPKQKTTTQSTDDYRIVFHILLGTMFAMFVVQPFLSDGSHIVTLFYTGILLVAALGTIHNRERWIGCLILVLVVIGRFWPEATLILVIVAYLLAIGVFVRWVFSHRTITSATVSGALCAYLMLGITWMLAYLVLLDIQPESFRNANGDTVDAFYYSFVTLTTLGYGDITPITKFAKSLSCLEALVGQIFLLAIVARLVGLQRVPDPPRQS